MSRTRLLARLSVLALGGVAIQALTAEEPATTTPPATSIREWRTTPGATAAAPTAPATSIREWRTTEAWWSKKVGVTKTPITISLKSTLREGSLVVVLDDVAVFNEKFRKPLLIVSQTTQWDPLQVPAGTHRLTAKVIGAKKTYFSKSYDLYVSPTKGSQLRFAMQGDKLTVTLGS